MQHNHVCIFLKWKNVSEIVSFIIIINPLTAGGRCGTTDDFATSFLNFSMFSKALWDLANSRPVHSLMLSSHLFLGLPDVIVCG